MNGYAYHWNKKYLREQKVRKRRMRRQEVAITGLQVIGAVIVLVVVGYVFIVMALGAG